MFFSSSLLCLCVCRTKVKRRRRRDKLEGAGGLVSGPDVSSRIIVCTQILCTTCEWLTIISLTPWPFLLLLLLVFWWVAYYAMTSRGIVLLRPSCRCKVLAFFSWPQTFSNCIRYHFEAIRTAAGAEEHSVWYRLWFGQLPTPTDRPTAPRLFKPNRCRFSLSPSLLLGEPIS